MPFTEFSTKNGDRVFIIAEAGSNWKISESCETNLKQAIRLIDLAAWAGCDAVKFQSFRPGALRFGDMDGTYSLPLSWLPTLKRESDGRNIEFMCSVFSLVDARAVDPFVKRHKIASCEAGYEDLVKWCLSTRKPVLVSTGGVSSHEAQRISSWTSDRRQLRFLHCVLAYPAPFAMHRYPYDSRIGITYSGISDHTAEPIILPIIAAFMGAEYVEKHFTNDRRQEGPDHGYAIEPIELSNLVRSVRAVQLLRNPVGPIPCENALIETARRRVVAIRPVAKGEKLTRKNMAVYRPGRKINAAPAYLFSEILGKRVSRSIEAGEGVDPDIL